MPGAILTDSHFWLPLLVLLAGVVLLVCSALLPAAVDHQPVRDRGAATPGSGSRLKLQRQFARLVDRRERDAQIVGIANVTASDKSNILRDAETRVDNRLHGSNGTFWSMEKKRQRSRRRLSRPLIITVHFAWQADGARHWLRAEIRDGGGELILLGNPIYIDWGGRVLDGGP